MNAQTSRFNQLLLVLMIVLYIVSLGMFTYLNWQVESEHILWNHLFNALILSIPLLLFFGSIYLLVAAWQEHAQTGQIRPRLARTIHWAPRIAAIMIIFFVTLFSLDVFGMGGTLLEQIGGFIIHSLPSIAMIILLAFAWKRPMIGFIAFLIAGLFFLRFVIPGFNLGNFLLFSGPLLLISAMFYIDWRWLNPKSPAVPGPAV